MRKFWVLVLLCLLFNVALLGGGLAEAAPRKKGRKQKGGQKDSVAELDNDDVIDAVLNRAKAETVAVEEPDSGSDADSSKRREARAQKAKQRARRAEKAASRLNTRLAEARKRNKKLATQRARKAKAARDARNKAQDRADKFAKQRQALDTPAMRQKGRERLNWLYSKAARSNNNIMSFTDHQFKEYALSQPRPYFLFLSFTARSPGYRCPFCHQAYDEMAIVARAYASKYNASREVELFGDDSAFPLFFAEVDIASAGETFQALQLNSAPTMVVLPPSIGEKPPRLQNFLTSLKMKYRFVALSASISAEDLTGFINKLRPGAQVHLERGINTQALLVYALLLAALASAAYFFRNQLLLLRQLRTPFLIGGWAVYLFCLAGGMYNIIRETPWSGYGQDGKEHYISQSGRDQYAFEGYLMGTCQVLAALFLTLAIKVMSPQDGEKPIAGGGKRGALSSFASFLNSTIAPPVLLALAGFMWFQVLVVYTQKNWHYRMGLLAGDVWKGWLD